MPPGRMGSGPPPVGGGPRHLVVVQNGLFGQARNVRFLAEAIRKELGPGAHVHISLANQFRKTTDGVDAGGRRLAVEVLEVAGRMEGLELFSIVGFSLGGLYARYAVAVLAACGFLEGGGSEGAEERALAEGLAWPAPPLAASCLVTIASPHMGSRRSQATATGRVLTWIGGRIFSATGCQLMLNDGAGDGGVDGRGNPLFVEAEGGPSPRASDDGAGGEAGAEPLLARMTRGAFLEALALFAHRACYGNTRMDRYPHILDVERAPVPLVAPGGDLGEDEYGTYESHQEPWRSMLIGMLQRLDGVGWERVPVLLPPPHTHGHIVVRVPVVNFSGKDVVRHVARNIKGVAQGYGRPVGEPAGGAF